MLVVWHPTRVCNCSLTKDETFWNDKSNLQKFISIDTF